MWIVLSHVMDQSIGVISKMQHATEDSDMLLRSSSR